ncbi:MAG TPA: glycosyltransferase family 4 protein [Nostoc sp.]|uniref:glycosyltransferase family 4 protein n=1 Tax=Nostoc sp. TaxID=1180 RepID=UPI002D533370|nr:glycosyltransferase family 4 protein [Nostoc sp.]HYX15428.1 glycosyltransferase family 4 protein [Nostoc sp.]
MYNFGFVVEQALGHVTHYQNLKHWVAEDADICPSWMPIWWRGNDIWKYMPVIGNNWSLRASLRTRDALNAARRIQPLDALFLHTQTLALFAIPFMRHIPTIISTDGTPLNFDTMGAAYNHKVGGNSLLERRKFLWNKSTYHNATSIVAFSQWAKDSVVDDYGVPAEKVTVIPPGVDLEQWNFRRNKTEHQSSTNALRLLFVGGDFARKGGYTLLEAFRNSLNQDCTLEIVTKDANLERKLAGIENIRVHCGLTPNSQPLKELYAQADIFVFPTQADCLPNAISEAMAVGLPVITTDVGALPEQVEHGVNGLIVPPSDPAALINAVRALKSDTKRDAMAAASHRIAEERFDARRNYRAILALMKSISKNYTETRSARYKASLF